MLKIVHMIVNDKEVEVAVDDRESLLETLRDRLGLTSVKKGCEVGECGACTVLVDGEAIDSCIYLTMWAEGRRIMTVEGLKGPNGELSTIQKAFVEEAAVQCGFCTPGLIMTAVEIVGTGKRYNREELRKMISGHLCRCTGYDGEGDKKSWFCSEFVTDAFAKAGHPLTLAQSGWISPADLMHMRTGDVSAFKPETQLQYVGHLKPGIYIKAGRFVGLTQ